MKQWESKNRLKVLRSQGVQKHLFLLTLLIFTDVPNGSVSYKKTEPLLIHMSRSVSGIVLHCSDWARVAAHPEPFVVYIYTNRYRRTSVEWWCRVLSLPWCLWAAGGEAQPRVAQIYQDPFPEGQEAVTHTVQHMSHNLLSYTSIIVIIFFFSAIFHVSLLLKCRLDHNRFWYHVFVSKDTSLQDTKVVMKYLCCQSVNV